MAEAHWGEFAAGLESITVGPYFAGNGIYEILISDSSNPDCISFVEFEEPDCIDACDIDIVEYNVVECNETDSLFYLEVFFEYDNLLGDAVSIFGGGYNWGIYNPLLQPILIGPFFTGDLEYEIIVADPVYSPTRTLSQDFLKDFNSKYLTKKFELKFLLNF